MGVGGSRGAGVDGGLCVGQSHGRVELRMGRRGGESCWQPLPPSALIVENPLSAL